VAHQTVTGGSTFCRAGFRRISRWVSRSERREPMFETAVVHAQTQAPERRVGLLTASVGIHTLAGSDVDLLFAGDRDPAADRGSARVSPGEEAAARAAGKDDHSPG